MTSWPTSTGSWQGAAIATAPGRSGIWRAPALPSRLARTYHARHDLSLATFHAHLDRDSCLEVTMLKGPSGEVRHFAEHVIAERGVHHGRLVLIPLPAGHGQHGAPPLALRRRAGRGG